MTPHGLRTCLTLGLALGCFAVAGCGLSREGSLAIDGSSSGAGASAGGSPGSGGSPSSGGGSSDGGGGGAAGGTGASGGGGAENCLDGRDNDGDDTIDCADADCQPGHECVPETPAGWSGHYRVLSLPHPAPTTTPCGDGSMPETYSHAPGGAAQCDACSCGAAEGASCSLPTLAWWVNASSCGGGPTTVFSPGDTSCHALPGSHTCFGSCSNDQRSSVGSPAMLTGQPSCPAAGGAATLPPMWGSDDHVCPVAAETGGGCDAGSVCIAKAAAPYDGAACISQAGEVACPGDWPNVLTTYGDGTDTRGCDACSCDATGVSCSGDQFTIYDDGACLGLGTSPVDVTGGSCPSMQNLVDNESASYRATAASLSGSCTPSGGQPTGAVVPAEPMTFCCR